MTQGLSVDTSLRRLRVLATVLPFLLVAVIEVSIHLLLGERLSEATAVVVTLAIILLGAVAFSWAVFRILAQVQQRLLERTELLAALHNAGLALSSELSLGPLLQKFVDLARELTGSRYGALGVLGPDGHIEEFITSGISQEERERIGGYPRGQGLLGVILREGTTLRLEELAADPRSAGFPPNHPPMRTLLGVPVAYKGRTLGNLYLTDKGAGAFSREDEELVALFASQAAISIENARLYREVQNLAILEERERIGMDLHDGVIQSLYAVGLNLEDCAEMVPTEPEKVPARLDTAINALNQVIKDIRSYIFHLRPSAMSTTDITEALSQLVQEIRVNTLMDAELTVDLDGTLLPEEHSIELFHMAQEALANVAKHSGATRVQTLLCRLNGNVALQVKDNGRGFDAQAAAAIGHRGLQNIADRARALGGSLNVSSKVGKGTEINVTVPLQREELDE